MSTSNNRRPSQPRPRREPLFPLEAEDIDPGRRLGPPAPLRDLLGDLDDALPTRAPLERRTAPARPERQPAPAAPRPEPPRPVAPPQGARQAQAAPQTLQRAVRPAAAVVAPAYPAPRPEPRPMRVADEPYAARRRYEDAEDDLLRAELLTARPYERYSAPRTPALPMINQWFIMGMVAMASLLVLLTLGGGAGGGLSRWGGIFAGAATSASNKAQLIPSRQAGDDRLNGAPSISPQQIDAILASYGSPATGTGAAWYNLGLQYGIDPAFAVAFFIHESSAGTNQSWAGIKPDGSVTHNVGNIICAGYATCYGRFRDYGSWEAGIEDWYRLIDVEYIKGRGTLTVQDIIPIYAPSFENDVQAYVDSVNNLVDSWRSGGVQ